MDILDLIRAEIRRLHQGYDKAIADLTPEQWHWVPGTTCNTVAFSVWHYARTEDNVVRFVIQRRPPVWLEGSWHERFGLPDKAQGTGMSTEEAHALRINDVEAFKRYMQGVWQATDELLANPPPGFTDEVTVVKPLGEMTKVQAVAQTCVSHGFAHLGQIELLRSLMGLASATGI